MVQIPVNNKEPNFTLPHLLFHPNIPKPMHGLNPRTLLGKAWWDKVRYSAYQENNYCCWACGTHKNDAEFHQWLEAHECYDINYEMATMKMSKVVALCHSCHNYIHLGRLRHLANSGEITRRKFNTIIEHGNKIVFRLKPPIVQPMNVNAWQEWRLIIDGVRYPGLFKDFNAWDKKYGRKK